MNQSERFKFIREKLGLSQQGLADSIAEKQGKIRDIEIGKQKIPQETALIMEKIHRVNFKWLLTGEGTSFTEEDLSHEDEMKIPIDYEQGASCGRGCFINDSKCPEFITLSKFWIKNSIGVSNKDLIIIFADGDSMEPSINNGDMLLVDKTQIDPKNGVYLVRFNEELFVKRIQIYPHKIKLISDNKLYDPIEISKDDFDGIKVVGKVVWNGSKLNI